MQFKRWLLITAGIFVFGFVVGLVFSLVKPMDIAQLLSEEMAALERLAGSLRPFTLNMMLFILTQNASALLLSFLLSPVLCLFPVLAVMFNGGLLAFVAVLGARQASVGFILAGLLPHGVFEIPALIIGEAAAIGFGATAVAAVFSPARRKLLIPTLRNNLRYLGLAGALLVPAAAIETFITPLLLGMR
ncbi:MAG: stage II sporulation protein M [Dehalococcoidales bacterium]|nr:stage II sporulation protein M [Dehalococcoidales bacterium]